jgi:microsomal dipeptidase-like Zn-dependent dipeptidase
MLEQGGVDIVLSNAYVPEIDLAGEFSIADLLLRIRLARLIAPIGEVFRRNYFKTTLSQLKNIESLVDHYNKRVKKGHADRPLHVVRTVDDLRRQLGLGLDQDTTAQPPSQSSEKAIWLVHAVEGGHSLNGDSAGKRFDPEQLANKDVKHEIIQNLQRLFLCHSVAMLTIAHFFQNYLAAPCFRYPEEFLTLSKRGGQRALDRYDLPKGLTHIGEAVVNWMLTEGMLIDVTHCTPNARRQIYELADAADVRHRIIATHVGAYEINPTPYNLEDWEIKWISDHGGAVGVIFMNYWLMPHATGLGMNYISRTIEHFRTVGGDTVVALGSDFDGFADPPDDLVDARQMARLTKRLAGEYIALEDGHVESTIERALAKQVFLRKYPDHVIERILGQNALNVLLNGWGLTDDKLLVAQHSPLCQPE